MTACPNSSTVGVLRSLWVQHDNVQIVQSQAYGVGYLVKMPDDFDEVCVKFVIELTQEV